MAKKIIDSSTLQDIADSIRSKTGKSGSIQVSDFADEIEDGIVTTKAGCTINTFIGDTDSSGVLQASTQTSVVLSGVTNVGANALQGLFAQNQIITTINFPNLTTVSGNGGCRYMLYNCESLTSANLSILTTISGGNGCYAMFYGCENLASVDLSGLTLISKSSTCKYMFRSCTSLTSLSFPALTSTSFGSYTNQFNLMLSGVTGCTVHFPSNLESVIGSWSDVTAGFGGTNTTVLFDLTATE